MDFHRTSGPTAGQVHLKTSEYTMLQSLISFSWCSIYGANPFPFPLFSLCSHCEAAVNRNLWWEIKPRRTPLWFQKALESCVLAQRHVISHFFQMPKFGSFSCVSQTVARGNRRLLPHSKAPCPQNPINIFVVRAWLPNVKSHRPSTPADLIVIYTIALCKLLCLRRLSL